MAELRPIGLSAPVGWVLALLFTAGTPVAQAADAFTPAQRAEIVAVVRDALQHDPSLLRDAITALQAEEDARTETDARAAIATHHAALVADPADPAFGDPHADLTVVEFLDPRCPYCRGMLPVTAELLRREPHVRLVVKELAILGPASALQARALLAAQRQNGFMRLQDALMRPGAPTVTDDAGIKAAAHGAGLDGQRLVADMADPAINAHLEDTARLAATLALHGTPAFVVGGAVISGATDLPTLRQAIAAARRG